MKVLIVDDNEQARLMMKHYLRELSNEFRECEDGADSLQAYAEFLPDWILMDWEMKRLDGLTATRKIIEKHPAAKILMVTQYDDEALREAAFEAGASGFILKENLSALRDYIGAGNCGN